jgi:hypothetical protein
MTIQEALTKASEGGYQHEFKAHEPGLRAGVVGLHAFRTIQGNDFFLDPEFWRALGRTLGWHPERVWRGQWQRRLLVQTSTPSLWLQPSMSKVQCGQAQSFLYRRDCIASHSAEV